MFHHFYAILITRIVLPYFILKFTPISLRTQLNVHDCMYVQIEPQALFESGLYSIISYMVCTLAYCIISRDLIIWPTYYGVSQYIHSLIENSRRENSAN